MSKYLEIILTLLIPSAVTWLIAYIYYKRQWKDSKFLISAERMGIVDVIAACRDFGTDREWSALIANAKHVVEILGYSMHETVDNEDFISELRDLIEKPKFQIRVLLANPTSPLIRQRSYALDIDPVHLTKRIYDAQQRLSKIIDPVTMIVDKREIRTFSDLVVPYSLIRVDDKMLIMPYMSTSGKKNSPMLVIKGEDKELFKRFTTDFTQAWRKSQPLHNPRVRVPNNYVQISSEKHAIARSVAQRFDNDTVSQFSIFNCLDIGCGDGTQSILTFNKIGERIKNVNVTFIDPSTFAVQTCEESLILKILSFAPRRPIVQRMWQEYTTEIKFQFIFCCHVFGSIYQQCGADEEFKKQFERMISALEPGGQICITLASERSIELQLRKRDRKSYREILSAERFETMLKQWDCLYEVVDVNSLLALEGWLGKENEKVSPQEREVMHFLFSPVTDLTHEIAEPYRSGLRSNAKMWNALQDSEKKDYLSNGTERKDIKDNNLFVAMRHVCFWIRPKKMQV